jgi:hypothetical protein
MSKTFKIGLLLLGIGLLLCFYSLYPLGEQNKYHTVGGNKMTFNTSKSIFYLFSKNKKIKLNPETDTRKRINKHEAKIDIIKQKNGERGN